MHAYQIEYYGDEHDGRMSVIRMGANGSQAKSRLSAERRGRGCRIAAIAEVPTPDPIPSNFGTA